MRCGEWESPPPVRDGCRNGGGQGSEPNKGAQSQTGGLRAEQGDSKTFDPELFEPELLQKRINFNITLDPHPHIKNPPPSPERIKTHQGASAPNPSKWRRSGFYRLPGQGAE